MKLGLLPVLFVMVGCGGAMSAPTGASRASGVAGVAAYPGAASPAAEVAAAPPVAPGMPSPTTAMASADAPAKTSKAAEATEAPVVRSREPQPQTGGLLTAGVWDDAKNYDFFLGFVRKQDARGSDFSLFSERELSDARAQNAKTTTRKRTLQVSIVFDTTGSMGDELGYLQKEIVSISSRLKQRLPEVDQTFSLVVYRDRGDEYVARAYPFTRDVGKFRETLAEQEANGGGDYPEAVIAGLNAASGLGWSRDQDVAKVAFWIADAPTHAGEGPAFAKVVRNMRGLGVHLYPIAASGADDLTEYEMRTAAFMTGGRYMFLTDDSGVGNAHAEPHVPCYAVTRLDQAMVRMLEVEVTGRHVPVEESAVVRMVGSPRADGTCVLGNGDLVAAY